VGRGSGATSGCHNIQHGHQPKVIHTASLINCSLAPAKPLTCAVAPGPSPSVARCADSWAANCSSVASTNSTCKRRNLLRECPQLAVQLLPQLGERLQHASGQRQVHRTWYNVGNAKSGRGKVRK
jgi:hypothetical protein